MTSRACAICSACIPPASIPVINSAGARHDRACADAELTEIVRESNALDCAFYAEARKRRGTRTPLPRRSERIADLVRRGVYSPIEGPTKFPMGGPLPGYGFWPADDGASKRHFRWTGPGNELAIELPVVGGKLRALVIDAYVPRKVGRVLARVEEYEVSMDWSHDNPRPTTITVPMPRNLNEAFTTVTLDVEMMSKASDGDDRRVGFVVGDMSIIDEKG